jgi:hypothetical protein
MKMGYIQDISVTYLDGNAGSEKDNVVRSTGSLAF